MIATTSFKVPRYGWKPDVLDWRDKIVVVKKARSMRTMPAKYDPRGIELPALPDQGYLGSCTANAIAWLHQYRQLQQGALNAFLPSRLAIYYGERRIENSINEDAGAWIRDGMKVVAKEGAAPESLWPYDIGKFRATPPTSYYTEAEKHQGLLYQRAPGVLHTLKQLLVLKQPVVFGFSVPQNFESTEAEKTGVIYFPRPGEPLVGGHAVCMVGYDDNLTFRKPGYLTMKGAFLCPNWWGAWGEGGYFWLPYRFVTKRLATDFWTLGAVE
jgi:C1A family cysteine protease